MSEDQPGALALKLNHLFSTVKSLDSNGKEYSNEFVAQQLTKAGVPISSSYIWQLRKGKKSNPTLEHIQGLAKFFGVNVDYFTNDEVSARIDSQLEILRAEQEARLNQIAANPEARWMAARAAELSPAGRRQLVDLLNLIYQVEHMKREGSEEGRK
ncbi:XRE family transcriptional regulator [Crossiella sp. CA-258035]|uniref:XRE family transcriptional regulator n=1 Tax=Crossiella sp. CA-258035 TaxID=2981138 RepID=UPI0024BCB5F8|nr:XRE family transcriptional regulator [Crossiella sp. CA-258035]WHT22548.1 XRE family transcriptional regulator [Crossiella sp. CA-258035]